MFWPFGTKNFFFLAERLDGQACFNINIFGTGRISPAENKSPWDLLLPWFFAEDRKQRLLFFFTSAAFFQVFLCQQLNNKVGGGRFRLRNSSPMKKDRRGSNFGRTRCCYCIRGRIWEWERGRRGKTCLVWWGKTQLAKKKRTEEEGRSEDVVVAYLTLALLFVSRCLFLKPIEKKISGPGCMLIAMAATKATIHDNLSWAELKG